MSAESELYDAISVDGAVVALVSTRVYPDVSPVDVALPAIAFSRVGTEFVTTIHGSVEASAATIEIWCMAATRTAAESVGDAAQAACTASYFMPIDRRAEYDAEAAVWASVITVSVWT